MKSVCRQGTLEHAPLTLRTHSRYHRPTEQNGALEVTQSSSCNMCSVALHGRWVARARVLTQPGLQSLILSLYFHRDRLKVLSLYFRRTDPGSFPLPSFSYRITYHISHSFSLRVYQAAHATSALLDLRNAVSLSSPSPFRP